MSNTNRDQLKEGDDSCRFHERSDRPDRAAEKSAHRPIMKTPDNPEKVAEEK